MKRQIARWMRRTADRIDHEGAPKAMPLSFTIEPGRGIVVHRSHGVPAGPGCPLWALNDDDYQRAHTEQVDLHAWIDTDTGQWRGVARP